MATIAKARSGHAIVNGLLDIGLLHWSIIGLQDGWRSWDCFWIPTPC